MTFKARSFTVVAHAILLACLFGTIVVTDAAGSDVFGSPIVGDSILHKGNFAFVVRQCLEKAPTDGKCTGHRAGDDIANWDVSEVTNMDIAFSWATEFDGDLGNWNVSSVENFNMMFKKASKFTGKGLENWDVSSGKTFKNMFLSATKFNGDIKGWQTPNAEDMRWMFDAADNFEQDLTTWTEHDGNTKCNWNTEAAQVICDGGQGADTRYMFDRANKFLGKYECGINGPPKECSVGTVIADTQDMEASVEEANGLFAVSDYETFKYSYLDDMTIWGTPRLNVNTGEIIENQRFILDHDYGYMLAGIVLPGVLIAGIIFVCTLAYFMIRFWTCCFFVITGGCGVCFKSRPPTQGQKKATKILVVFCSVISVVGAALLFYGASELPLTMDEMMVDLTASLTSLEQNITTADDAFSLTDPFDVDQTEGDKLDNTLSSIRKVVDKFQDTAKTRIDETEKAAMALAAFFVLLSLLVSLAVLCNFKMGLIFTGIPFWLLLLIAWIMFGVFMGVAQFFDDFEATATFWRGMDNNQKRAPGSNAMKDLDDILPCFSDKVSLDIQTSARNAIYEGIFSINESANQTDPYMRVQRVNEKFEPRTISELCGPKTNFFRNVDDNFDNYEALACNLYELDELEDTYEVYTELNDIEITETIDGPSIKLNDLEMVYSYYYDEFYDNANFPGNNFNFTELNATVKAVVKMLEEGKPAVEKIVRCTHTKSFIQQLVAKETYVRADSGNTYIPPDATIIERLREYSTILTAAWFLIAISYMVTYVILIKFMMMLQAEDREKLSEEEMNQVWGRSYSKNF